MKLTRGEGVTVATDRHRCDNNCGNWISIGDRCLSPHPGILLCKDCWPDAVKARVDSARTHLCPECNLYHARSAECW